MMIFVWMSNGSHLAGKERFPDVLFPGESTDSKRLRGKSTDFEDSNL